MAEEDAQQAEITKISIKVPPFWKINPALWFKQLEAQFIINRITADKKKFYTVVASLESEILSTVSDIVLSPPEGNLYDAIKERLILEFSESNEKKLTKILTGLHLGDRRPSQLLKEMKELSSNKFPEDVLKSLWIRLLPPNCQAVLCTSEENLQKISLMADKILELTNRSSVDTIASTSTPEETPEFLNKFQSLEGQIIGLRQEVEQLSIMNRKLAIDRNRFRRQYPPGNNANPSSSSSGQICWYHQKFGSKARKCVTPCKYFLTSEN